MFSERQEIRDTSPQRPIPVAPARREVRLAVPVAPVAAAPQRVEKYVDAKENRWSAASREKQAAIQKRIMARLAALPLSQMPPGRLRREREAAQRAEKARLLRQRQEQDAARDMKHLAKVTKQQLAAFYAVFNPNKTEKDVNATVNYYVVDGGKPGDGGESGFELLQAQLRATYGADLDGSDSEWKARAREGEKRKRAKARGPLKNAAHVVWKRASGLPGAVARAARGAREDEREFQKQQKAPPPTVGPLRRLADVNDRWYPTSVASRRRARDERLSGLHILRRAAPGFRVGGRRRTRRRRRARRRRTRRRRTRRRRTRRRRTRRRRTRRRRRKHRTRPRTTRKRSGRRAKRPRM